MTLAVMLAVLLAQVTPSPSPAPTPCSREASGIALDDYRYKGPSKGAPLYFAVVQVRVNPDGTIKWGHIYKSSGIADYESSIA